MSLLGFGTVELAQKNTQKEITSFWQFTDVVQRLSEKVHSTNILCTDGVSGHTDADALKGLCPAALKIHIK